MINLIRSRKHESDVFIPFWNTLLSIRDPSYREVADERMDFQVLEDEYSDIYSYLNNARLMRTEHTDGEISRDVVRTFQRHQLFRNTENGGQAVLERVLRRISETNWGLGYCQGMNYVAGAIMIAQIDPDVKASYLEKSQPSCKITNPSTVASTTYEIFSHLIHALGLRELWGFGLPAISFYTYALRYYLKITNPAILEHLGNIGYELSIVVARWFIPLFSDSLPLRVVFNCWSFLFSTGLSALFRITIALLLQYEENILLCDCTNFSELMNSIGSAYMRKESDVERFYKKLGELSMINEESLQRLREEYNAKQKTCSADVLKRVETIDEDIESIQSRIHSVYVHMLNLLSNVQRDIQTRQQFVAALIELQESKLSLALRYDSLESMMDQAANEMWSENEGTKVELELRSISRQLTENSKKMRETDLTIQQMVKRIDSELSELEDCNTQRLSFQFNNNLRFIAESFCSHFRSNSGNIPYP